MRTTWSATMWRREFDREVVTRSPCHGCAPLKSTDAHHAWRRVCPKVCLSLLSAVRPLAHRLRWHSSPQRATSFSALLPFQRLLTQIACDCCADRSRSLAIVIVPGHEPDFVPIGRNGFLAAMGDLGLSEGRDFLIEQSGAQYGETNFDEAANALLHPCLT